MSENEFTMTFLRRQNDPLWKEVMLVQTNVKAKVGIGKIINIKFYAPVPDEKNRRRELCYDFDRLGEDFDLDDEEMCHKQ